VQGPDDAFSEINQNALELSFLKVIVVGTAAPVEDGENPALE